MKRARYGLVAILALLVLGLTLTLPRTIPSGIQPAQAMSFEQLLQFASNDINRYWSQTFSRSGKRYSPPRDVIGYTRPIQTPCGVMSLNNAFYCIPAHSIYFDKGFLYREYRQIGDYAAVSILAHEWGHSVQAQLGISRSNNYSIQVELQADCFAGSYTRHAGQAGYLEPGDVAEAGTSLFRNGDRNTPWFDVNAHGTPQQRVRAFSDGLNGGANACFAR